MVRRKPLGPGLFLYKCSYHDVVSQSQVLRAVFSSFSPSPLLPLVCPSRCELESRRDLSRAHHRLPRGRCLSGAAWLPTLPHALCFGMGARRLRDIWDYYVVFCSWLCTAQKCLLRTSRELRLQGRSRHQQRCQPRPAATLSSHAGNVGTGSALLR